MTKTQQLQIRVSPEEKAQIKKRANEAGMEVSNWVLAQVLPSQQDLFQQLCRCLATVGNNTSYVFAELNDFFCSLNNKAFSKAVSGAPDVDLPPFEANYLAAMIEQAAAKKQISPPSWISAISPLDKPWFASSLKSLRLHLLTNSPPPFRRRNLFIDSGVGSRV